ncbi:MAG: NAD-dependent DNA ligase LigA [bacterium]
MNKTEVKQRMDKLKEMISHHRYLYHVLDRQDLSDEAFDSLKHELYMLEKDYPEFITFDSPTQRVGGEPLKKFKKINHEIPMLSIEDIFFEEELADWVKYIKKLEKNTDFEYFVEPKIDGFGVSLVYGDGILRTGSTRGNGKIGEDVTQNLKTVESIPLKLEIMDKLPNKDIENKTRSLINNGRIEIRGEVYMEKADFNEFNKKLEKKGEKPFANPRNLAAGSIRQLNPKLAASRPLKFLGYDIVTDMLQTKHSEEHQILTALGFKSTNGKICKNLFNIVNFWKEIAKKRNNLPYQIDGTVLSVNNNKIFKKLGVAGKSPRGIRAFKFAPKQSTTKILDIKVQVGRTGAITPIAILKPVKIEGVTITRATLHNESEIKRLGVKIGDTVVAERAGDVIPAISKVIKELRTGKEKEFSFPKKCPICETKLIKPEDEAVWRCTNTKCPARKKEILYHFVSKKAFDIVGMGPKIVEKLITEKLIFQPADIFELKEGDLVPLEKFAEKSSKNLIKSIEKSKKIELSKFIFSLGIRHVGEETAIDLANNFGTIEKLKKAKKEELIKIPEVGDKVAESIYNWFQSKESNKFLDSLLRVGINIIVPQKRGRKLEGKLFVLTGSLDNMARNEAEKRIRSLGGNPSGSVSKNTNYLVVGSNPGSKLAEAEKLGVKVIREKQFLSLIK